MTARFGLLLLLAISATAQQQVQASKEAALGEMMAREVRRHTSPIHDAAIRSYVSAMATKLAGPQLLINLEIVDSTDDATQEPVWLPGGYVFVSCDLIREARDESEFAAMLAHALAHEIARDRSNFARELEMRADASAMQMMAKAGYDPAALLRYISRIDPSQTQRIEGIRTALAALGERPVALLDSSQFQQLRERLVTTSNPPSLLSSRP
jgi:predicted Zn-dependent protease